MFGGNVALLCVFLHNFVASRPNELKEDTMAQLMDRYHNYIIPQENPSIPMEIKIQLIVLGMKPKDGAKLFNHYNIDLILQQSWYDYRLRHDNDEILTLSGDVAEQIWRPDTRVMGEKKIFPNKLTKPNIHLNIYPNGTVVSSQRCQLVNFCHMDYRMFPFDSQICDFRLETFSYSREHTRLLWMYEDPKNVFVVSRDLNLEEFDLNAFRRYNETFHYNGNGSGTHDHLVVEMRFTRPVAFYIVRMYVPLCIVVMISWTSFWVDYRSLSARVTVGITTVLTIVELRLKIYKGDAPAGQTVNFFDYYSLICFIFVFTALIEYSFAQSMDIKYRLHDWYLATQGLNPDDDVDYEDTVEQNKTMTSSTSEKIPKKHFKGLSKLSFEYLDYCHSLTRDRYHALDKISQFVFPSAFVLMNIVYIGIVMYYRQLDDMGLEKFIQL